MSDNEIKIVTRQETFTDHAVKELARNRAACICRLQFGRCHKSRCRSCPAHKEFRRCYDSMSDYNRLRLDTNIADEYVQLSANPFNWYDHKTYIRKYVQFVLGLAGFMILITTLLTLMGGCSATKPMDKPLSVRTSSAQNMPGNIPAELDNMIMDVLETTRNNVWDLDKDGRVDCCDYTILFKSLWDLKYPARKNSCEIVRNYNTRTGMNHLFIFVRHGGKRFFVEPRASGRNYTMQYNWGSKYDPRENRYGETRKWLSTIR